MKKFSVIVLMLILGLTASSQTTIPFYIIIGQSNTGWCTTSGMNPQQAAQYSGLIPNTEIWNPGVGGWSAVWNPLNVGANTMPENYADPSQFGLEASLFKSLQNADSKKRLVYKQGQGGTTIAEDWRPPLLGQQLYQAGRCYAQFAAWLEMAATQAKAKNYKLDLKAIIWMQGEDDAKTLVDATSYLVNLTNFFISVDNMWKGYANTLGFPVNSYKKVVGRIYAPTAYPFRDLVRTAQAAYCVNPLNNAIMINCDNYPLQDWVHYNATGQIQFGLDIYNSAQFEGPVVAPSGISFSGKVFLQGAYNANAKAMNSTLNNLGILQQYAVNQPYNTGNFAYSGSESVGAGFFALHPEIVDWVLVELRNSASPSTIVAKRAAFLRKDGTLVDIDGTTPSVNFPTAARGNYFVTVRHRNHLGIRSSSALDFSNGSASYDYTTASNKVYQYQAYTSTVAVNGVWLMRGGNADLNTNVKYNGPQNDQDRIQNITLGGSLSLILNAVYSPGDVNMDGNIRTNGPENDQNILLNTILDGMIGAVFVEQL